jgi:hypothetical protein
MLERRFDGWNLNRAWVADITYLHTVEGWLYLAVVMDLASRRIVGWSMSDRLRAELVCQALPKPDQGSSDSEIDEPQGQLLGQFPDGELLQDAEG